MIADYTQRTEDGSITHKDCEYIAYGINDLGNGEILAKGKVKNLEGKFVGLIPFFFKKAGVDEIQVQAEMELAKLLS